MASRNVEWTGPVTRGTGNVFADLGFPDAAGRQARLRLAYALNQGIEARKLSQAAAAEALGVTQPTLCALRQYRLACFSLERLMNLLTAADFDVEIVDSKEAPFAEDRPDQDPPISTSTSIARQAAQGQRFAQIFRFGFG